MQRFLPALVLLGVLGACQRDTKAALRYVATGEKGERFYVDTSTLRASPSPGERSFTLVAVESSTRRSFGATYDRSVTTDRVDCSQRVFTLGDLKGYRGDSLVFADSGENAVPLRRGSALDSVATFVCAHR